MSKTKGKYEFILILDMEYIDHLERTVDINELGYYAEDWDDLEDADRESIIEDFLEDWVSEIFTVKDKSWS